MAIQLVESNFTLLPAGERVLEIKNIAGKPKANPTVIEIDFVDVESGTKHKHKYDLKYEGANIGFSILARLIMGSETKTIDLGVDAPNFVGKEVVCLVEHTKPNEKGNVFANVKKTLALREQPKVATSDEEDDL